MLDFILSHKHKFDSLINFDSHALLLESMDTTLTQNLAKVIAMQLACLGQSKPCGICSSCLKIRSNNSLDTFIYPKKEAFLKEDVDEILDNINIIPAENPFKVFIINNFDETNLILQNKLLKSIEEPPQFVKFILTAKSRQRVIPTIHSRCEVVSLPKFSSSELASLIDYLPSEERQLMLECANGSVSLLEKIKTENNFVENYNFALSILLNMQTSRDMLSYASKIDDKQRLLEIVSLINNFLSDVVKINSGLDNLVQNKYCLAKLKQIASTLSTKACLNIQDKILTIQDKIKFNGNLNIVIDDLLLSILEEKWKNKK